MGMSTSARLILGLAMSLIAPATTPEAAAPTIIVAELFNHILDGVFAVLAGGGRNSFGSRP